jgi:hypothetical protein
MFLTVCGALPDPHFKPTPAGSHDAAMADITISLEMAIDSVQALDLHGIVRGCAG